MTVRKSAWLVCGLVTMAVASPASGEEACVSASAQKKLQCDGKKLKPSSNKRAIRVNPPSSDPAGRVKELGPADPTGQTNNTPRIDRALKDKGRKFLLREIASVTKLYRDTPKKSKEKGQLLRRLADNYAELEADLYREQIETETDAQTVRRTNPKRAAKLKKRAADIRRRVSKARKEAIRHYKRLADKHPKFCLRPNKKVLADRGCADQALYYLAYEYELAKRFDDARKQYLRIVDKWPKSKYVPHAYLAFGELYFNEAQGDPSRWPLAQKAYEQVTSFPAPKNPLWGYAHYKLGYVHWNQGAHDEALEHFQKVIGFGTKHHTLPNAKGIARAARRDIIPVYAMAGEASKAFSFLSPLSGDSGSSKKKTFQMMEDLGQAYMDTGHYTQARALYADLKKRNGGEATCRYQVMITKATIAITPGNDKRPVVDALNDQLAAYLNNRDGGYGKRARLGCANHTASLLAETAMAWHLEVVGSGGVRGTGDKTTLKHASKLYGMVSDNFTPKQFGSFRFPHIVKEDWPTLGTLRFHQADILFEQKKWRACGSAFHAAYEADPQGKRAPDALFAAGQCWQNAVLQAKGGKGYRERQAAASGDNAYAARPFDSDEKKMLEAFDAYACKIAPPPDDDKALEDHCEVKFARARAYYDANHFDEAALAFRDIAMNHPSCEAGVFAANLYLDSVEVMRTKLGKAACVDDLSVDAPKLSELYCNTDAAREENTANCAVLDRVNIGVARLGIERLVKSVKAGDPNASKKLASAGDRYWKMWKERGTKVCEVTDDEGDEDACQGYDEVLHNAAAAYDGAHLLAKAMSVRKAMVSDKYRVRQTDLGKKALLALGANFQAIAVYDQAAHYYERFATEHPGMDRASTALSDAVVLRLGLGEADKALADARQFAKAYGSKAPRDAAQIAFAIGAHHVERGAYKDAEKALSGALKQIDAHATVDVRVQTHALLGRIHAELGQLSKADRSYGRARGAAAKLDEMKKQLDALDEPESRRARRFRKLVTAVGEALHHFADKEKRKADAITFPKYTGGGSEADINRFVKTKIEPWLKKKRPALDRATDAYTAVIEINQRNPPPKWAIAAGAAVGEMWGGLVDDFVSSPYPSAWDQPGYVPNTAPPLLWAELRAMYVNALEKKVEPFKQVAKGAFEKCVKYGLDYQHFDRELRTCEKWLAKRYPAEFHIVDELVAPPARVSSGLDERPQALAIDGAPLSRRRTQTTSSSK